MARSHSTPTVLMLDNELGFMFALAEELRRREIAAFPSRTVEEAEALVEEFDLHPAVLVVNCAAKGASGLTQGLAKSASGLQVIGITSNRADCREIRRALAATFRDPEDRQPEGVERCAGVIQVLLKRLRRHAKPATATE